MAESIIAGKHAEGFSVWQLVVQEFSFMAARCEGVLYQPEEPHIAARDPTLLSW
jgi:hypothetical protein